MKHFPAFFLHFVWSAKHWSICLLCCYPTYVAAMPTFDLHHPLWVAQRIMACLQWMILHELGLHNVPCECLGIASQSISHRFPLRHLLKVGVCCLTCCWRSRRANHMFQVNDLIVFGWIMDSILDSGDLAVSPCLFVFHHLMCTRRCLLVSHNSCWRTRIALTLFLVTTICWYKFQLSSARSGLIPKRDVPRTGPYVSE